MPAKKAPKFKRAKSEDIMDLSLKVCEHIATGSGILDACKSAGVSHLTFYKLMAKDPSGPLVANYMRARENRADARFEKVDDIMQELREGKIDPQSARVMLDAIKWQTGKENAKRYGDKLDVTSDGEKLPTLVINVPSGGPKP